ncbi:MAG: C39 family peptidase [Caldilineaceae bacterium]
MRLNVPHFKQEASYTCLPACIRMVLAFLGKSYTEHELAKAFQTIPWVGTLPENVTPVLEEWGYIVRWFENGTVDHITRIVAQRLPVIAFVRAADLPHGVGGFHAVVIVKIDSRSVILLDPTLDTEWRLSTKEFSRIWTKFGNEGMVILSPMSKP